MNGNYQCRYCGKEARNIIEAEIKKKKLIFYLCDACKEDIKNVLVQKEAKGNK